MSNDRNIETHIIGEDQVVLDYRVTHFAGLPPMGFYSVCYLGYRGVETDPETNKEVDSYDCCNSQYFFNEKHAREAYEERIRSDQPCAPVKGATGVVNLSHLSDLLNDNGYYV